MAPQRATRTPNRRNWSPATTFEDYWRNVREGLEPLSERCIAALMGMPRIEIYRWWLMAELPDDLFEALVAALITSAMALAPADQFVAPFEDA